MSSITCIFFALVSSASVFLLVLSCVHAVLIPFIHYAPPMRLPLPENCRLGAHGFRDHTQTHAHIGESGHGSDGRIVRATQIS